MVARKKKALIKTNGYDIEDIVKTGVVLATAIISVIATLRKEWRKMKQRESEKKVNGKIIT